MKKSLSVCIGLIKNMKARIILLIVVGLTLAIIAFIYWNNSNRYILQNSKFGVYRVDKKTGETWRIIGDTIQKVEVQEKKSPEVQEKKEEEKKDESSEEQDPFERAWAIDTAFRLGYVNEDNTTLKKEDADVLNEYREFVKSFEIKDLTTKIESIDYRDRTIVSVSILNGSNYIAHGLTLMAYYYKGGSLIDTQEVEYEDETYIGKNLARTITFQIPDTLEYAESQDVNANFFDQGRRVPIYPWDSVDVKIIAAKRIAPVHLDEKR